jgi:hypothetical protein
LLEGPAEVEGAQSGEVGERRKRDRLGQVLVDVGRDDALLPSAQAASSLCHGVIRYAMKPHQLMCEHGTQGFEVELVIQHRGFQQLPELGRRSPQRLIRGRRKRQSAKNAMQDLIPANRWIDSCCREAIPRARSS